MVDSLSTTLEADRDPASCPCGFYGDTTRECCSTGAIIPRYPGKISGPLFDRIELYMEVPAVPYQELRGREDSVECEETDG